MTLDGHREPGRLVAWQSPAEPRHWFVRETRFGSWQLADGPFTTNHEAEQRIDLLRSTGIPG